MFPPRKKNLSFLPQVLIIGMPKAGSKALRWMMGMHSKIEEVAIKGAQEVSFFNHFYYMG